MQKQVAKSTTKNLLLDSLQIQGFRGFRHLTIERLGRVNLIVGKNGVGKSSLLEAMRLYAQRGFPNIIWEMLESRDEMNRLHPSDAIDAEEQALSIRHLFYGREDVRNGKASIRIGQLNSKNKVLSISVDWYAAETDEEGNQRWHLLDQGDLSGADAPELRLATQVGEHPRLSYPLDPNMPASMWLRRFDRPEFREVPNNYISAGGFDKRDLSRAWNKTALTEREQPIIDGLRILAPGVERLSMIGDEQRPYERIPIVKMENLDNPISLRSMGEGMNRMFDVTLALVNTKDGVLLMDEIESGLHYSIQTNMWRLIFEVASRLNVQVFATTHSWDCIEAFTKAAVENEREEGLLIRLSERKGDIVATLFDEKELTIATRDEIEVR